jgi:hypothetical protein
MESWLGERIRKRLESLKDQLQLVLNGYENLCCTQDSREEGSAMPIDRLAAFPNQSNGS